MFNKARLGLPDHFDSDYPAFVRYLELFFEWKDRRLGVGIDESMLADEAGVRYSGQVGAGSGGLAQSMAEDHHLERFFQNFVTSDNKQFITSDNREFRLAGERTESLDAWYKDVSFPRARNLTMDQIVPVYRVDEIRFLKLIRDISQIRGTAHATKLFFKLAFNEDVTLEYPRDQIAVIDTGFIIDDPDYVIRDDHYYDEFAYVVVVKQDPSVYKPLFDTIYREFFHAGGFTPFLRQATS